MKKVLIALAVALQFNAQAQKAEYSSIDPTTWRSLVYSELHKAIVYEDSTSVSQKTILIKSLPPLSEDSIPVRIILGKGSYVLAKSPDLSIPYDYRVYLEDTWEEKNYNLNSSKSYAFKVKDEYPDRFVLRIDKPVLRHSSYSTLQ